MQVHKETIDNIPAALPGRDSIEIEVYGMEGIPDDAVQGDVDDESPAAKQAKLAIPSMRPPVPAMMGFPPMPPHHMMMPFPPMMPPGFMHPMRAPYQTAPGPSSIGATIGGAGVALGRPRAPFIPSAMSMPVSSVPLPTAAPQHHQPTFPAYGMNALVNEQTTKESKVIGASTKIVHPEENISLEERRAAMAKYNRTNPAPTNAHKPPLQGMVPSHGFYGSSVRY